MALCARLAKSQHVRLALDAEYMIREHGAVAQQFPWTGSMSVNACYQQLASELPVTQGQSPGCEEATCLVSYLLRIGCKGYAAELLGNV